MSAEEESGRDGQTATLTCPDCGGALWQINTTRLVQKTARLEAALTESYRLLKEKGTVLRQTADRARAGGFDSVAARLDEQAAVDERHAEALRRELLDAEPSSIANAQVADEPAGAPPDDTAPEE